MEWQTILRSAKQRLCSLTLRLDYVFIKKWLVIHVWNPNFLPSILLGQVWSQWVLGHFGNLETLSTTFMLTILAKSTWNLVKKWQEFFLSLENLDFCYKTCSWALHLFSSDQTSPITHEKCFKHLQSPIPLKLGFPLFFKINSNIGCR